MTTISLTTGLLAVVASAPATRVIGAMTHSDLFWLTVIEEPAIGAGTQIATVSQVALGTPDARIALPVARMGLFPSVIFDRLSRTMGRRAAAFTACMTGVSLSGDKARGARTPHRGGGHRGPPGPGGRLAGGPVGQRTRARRRKSWRRTHVKNEGASV